MEGILNFGHQLWGNSSTSDENQSNSETKTLSTRNNLEQLQNVLGRDQIWLGLTTNDLDSIPLTSWTNFLEIGENGWFLIFHLFFILSTYDILPYFEVTFVYCQGLNQQKTYHQHNLLSFHIIIWSLSMPFVKILTMKMFL